MPILELVEESPDPISPFVFNLIVQDWIALVALCQNDNFDIGVGASSRNVTRGCLRKSGLFKCRDLMQPHDYLPALGKGVQLSPNCQRDTALMNDDDKSLLRDLSRALRKEQSALLFAAAKSGGLPSNSTIQRVAYLELNIAAIENTIADPVA